MAGWPSDELRTVRPADLPAVAALLRSQWPTIDWEARFQRQWFDNPAATAGLPLGWVVESGDGLQGFFGNIPVPYQIEGRDALACAATSLIVRPEARGRRIGERLVHAYRDQAADLLLNTTPNAPSAHIFEAGGFARQDALGSTAHVVARHRGHARRRFASHPVLGALAQPLSWVGGAWLAARQRLPHVDEQGWQWRERAADGPLADIWQQLGPLHAATLRRDEATLRWLLSSSAQRARNHLLVRQKAGEVGAMALFREEPQAHRLRQVDGLGRFDTGAVVGLARCSRQLARDRGLDLVRLWLPPGVAQQGLATLGPAPVRGAVYFRPGGLTPYLTPLDGDHCLALLD